ncbi:MAG TPA: tryptophan 7-halogenase, partial [Polyangiales bacterium]
MQPISSASGAQGRSPRPRLRHAVIVGGSFAGLLAARALWPACERITLIERDLPPNQLESPRKGVPQGQHAHVLLNSGLSCLREFFPDLDQELEAHAGPAFDLLEQTRWRIEGRFRPRFPSEYRAYAIGRPALEALVRRRVSALAGVTLEAGRSVAGLRFEADQVTGVVLTDGEVLAADLVVDASGRGTRTPRWLREAGFEAPASQTLELGLTYTSFVLEPRDPAGFDHDFRLLLLPPQPPHALHGGLI